MDLWQGDRPLLLVAVLAAVGLAGLSVYALTLTPDRVAIGDLHHGHVGAWVQVQGRLHEPRVTSAGFAFVLVDPLDGAAVGVFVPLSTWEAVEDRENLVEGAEVRVRGEVQLYRDALEILVTAPGDLVLVSPPGPPPVQVQGARRG